MGDNENHRINEPHQMRRRGMVVGGGSEKPSRGKRRGKRRRKKNVARDLHDFFKLIVLVGVVFCVLCT